MLIRHVPAIAASVAGSTLIACSENQEPCDFSGQTLTGAYAVTVTSSDTAREGTAIIWASGNGAAGRLDITGAPAVHLRRVRAEGNRLAADGIGSDSTATLTWTFSGESFVGEARSGANVTVMKGRRLPPCSRTPGPPAGIDVAALTRQLTDSIPVWLGRYNEPGLAVAIVDHGTLQWTGTFGITDVETRQPVRPQTLYAMGSISKTFAAWAVMTLVEEGKVELDAPVQRYLRQWSLPVTKYPTDQITVRQLLSHTAGVGIPSVVGVSLTRWFPTLQDFLDGQVPEFEDHKFTMFEPPGMRVRYSGGGYMILQMVVEDVTGERFTEYVRRRILAPLGMQSSAFAWADIATHVATPYKEKRGETYPQLIYPAAAAAGLYSSVEDMTMFLLAHFSVNGPAGAGVITPETLTRMMRPDSVAARYGLGYEIVPVDGLPRPGHAGSNPGWRANFLVIPERGFAVVVMTNVEPGNARSEVLNAVRRAM